MSLVIPVKKKKEAKKKKEEPDGVNAQSRQRSSFPLRYGYAGMILAGPGLRLTWGKIKMLPALSVRLRDLSVRLPFLLGYGSWG